MNPTESLRAKIVANPPGETPFRGGEEVPVLGLDRSPDKRWLVRVSGPEGREFRLRPCCVGEARRPGAPRMPELADDQQMMREYSFWRQLWKSSSPRKAEAMELMGDCLSRAAKGKGGASAGTILHAAWSRYKKERRTH